MNKINNKKISDIFSELKMVGSHTDCVPPDASFLKIVKEYLKTAFESGRKSGLEECLKKDIKELEKDAEK